MELLNFILPIGLLCSFTQECPALWRDLPDPFLKEDMTMDHPLHFAFLIMGSEFESARHRSYFESTGNLVTTIGVPSLEAACEEARELAAEGIELIEVCGAFGPEGAAAVAQAAGDKVAVGYVVHDPSQDEKFAALFG